MDIERSILKIIRGEKRAPLIAMLLAVFSIVYRSLIALRNFAYDQKIFSSVKLDVPVVSIGNVVVGGTGKTPFVHLLACALQDKISLGILARGFKSQIEKSGEVKKICPANARFLAAECGDEPCLLAMKTRAQVWSCPDRSLSGTLAIKDGVQCLLLDDGMQHRRVARDFEIVLVDGNDPFSKRRFLPWGLLRDSPKRLKKADLIVATHVKSSAHYKELQSLLSHLSSAPVVGTQVEVAEKENFKFCKAGVFCGIGQPARFLQTVRDLKSEIVDTLILKDHENVELDQLQKFAEHCLAKGAEVLLCTEKDDVKLPPDLSLCLPIKPIKIELKIIAGFEHWERLLENILNLLHKVEK